MLRPHYTENAQLGNVWLSSQNADDLLVFFGRQPMLFDQLGRDFNFEQGVRPGREGLSQTGL